jgi:hypothetical protein
MWWPGKLLNATVTTRVRLALNPWMWKADAFIISGPAPSTCEYLTVNCDRVTLSGSPLSLGITIGELSTTPSFTVRSVVSIQSALELFDGSPGAALSTAAAGIRSATLQCAVRSTRTTTSTQCTSRYPSFQAVTVDVAILPSIATFVDTIFVEVPGETGLFTSALQAFTFNITGTSGCVDAEDWMVSNSRSAYHNESASGWTRLNEADTGIRACLIRALSMFVDTPDHASTQLNLAIPGRVHMLLIANPYSPVLFSTETNIYVAQHPCTINWISDDRSIISVTTPTYVDVCGSGKSTRECGLQDLSLSPLPGTIQDAAQAAVDMISNASTNVASSVIDADGIVLRWNCPPACPDLLRQIGGADQGAWTAIASFMSNDVASHIESLRATGLQQMGVSSSVAAHPFDTAQYSFGMRYVETCTGGYLDPLKGECTDPTEPSNWAKCGYGVADSCVPCSSVCPGGYRLWPRPGYWISNELQAKVVECTPPDALLRCTGFSDANALTGSPLGCGIGYKTGTYACRGCAHGYYTDVDERCAPCPSADDQFATVAPAMIFVAGMLAFGVFIWLIAYMATARAGGTLYASWVRAKDLVIWMWIALQALVSVSRGTRAVSPSWLGAVYRLLGYLQFEGLNAPPECFSRDPMDARWAVLWVFLCFALLILTVLAYLRTARTQFHFTFQPCRRALAPLSAASTAVKPVPQTPTKLRMKCERRCTALFSYSLTVSIALYALVTFAVLDSLSCTNVSMDVRSYLELQQDGTTLRKSTPVFLEEALHLNLSFSQTFAVTSITSPAAYAAFQSYASRDIGLVDLPPALQPGAAPFLSMAVEVSILDSNPFVVCYERKHTAQAALAATTFVVYCLVLPIVLLLWVYAVMDTRLGAEAIVGLTAAAQWKGKYAPLWMPYLRALVHCHPCQCAHCRRKPAPPQAAAVEVVVTGGTDRQLAATTSPVVTRKAERTSETTVHDFIEQQAAAFSAKVLKPFTTASYKQSKYYFLQLDMLVILAVSIPPVLAKNSSITYRSAAAAFTCIVCLASAALIHVTSPFSKHFRWKSRVRVYMNCLSACTAVGYVLLSAAASQETG